jgi:hypothetical protein
LPPARFRRRQVDRRSGRERRGRLELPPRSIVERVRCALQALGSNPPAWLAAFFLIAAGLAWFLPALGIPLSTVTLIDGVLIVGGSLAILLYQSATASVLERRLKAEEVDLANLRRLYKALESKLTLVQTKLDLAIADCEELRDLNALQSRMIADLSRPGQTSATLEPR